MPQVKMSSKGQIVVPKEMRDKIGLKPNRPVLVELVGDHVEVSKAPDLITELTGALAGGQPLTKELEKEHREEVAKDARVSN